MPLFIIICHSAMCNHTTASDKNLRQSSQHKLPPTSEVHANPEQLRKLEAMMQQYPKITGQEQFKCISNVRVSVNLHNAM